MEINIDVNAKTRKVHNFWNHVHFHPTDAIEDGWGKEILNRIAQDHCAEYVRIYAMLEDVVTKKDGKLCYDFALTDQRIDFMLQKGFGLLICFNFMPKAIAEDDWNMSDMPRYKDKRICMSRPKDYGEWQEVCYQYTKHLVDRYGADTVGKWYFHCWNEADHHYWLNSSRASAGDQDKLEEYLKLYDHFAAGVTRATDRVKIGGPSAAGNRDFIEGFVRHTKEGVNAVTGKTGSRIDFFSIHTYASFPGSFDKGTFPSVSGMLNQTRQLNAIFQKYGYENNEIIVDEWGAASIGHSGMERYPEVIFRETAYYPAFLMKMIDRYIRAIDRESIPLSKMMICLCGQHDLIKDFDGYRSFFTLSKLPKPIYNGYVLAAKLGDEIIDFALEDDCLGVLPTKQGDHIKIVLYYIEDNFRMKIPNQKIRLKLDGLSGRYEIRHYRIDEDTSNSYAAYLKQSSPEHVNQNQREAIMQAGELSLLYPTVTVELNGTYDEDIIMKQNAVSFIELIKK